MTQTDLRLEYKRATGKEIPNISSNMYESEAEDCKEYVEWLENEYLQIRNILGINERALNIMKNMK